MRIAGQIRDLVDTAGAGPVFVHSDPFRTARLVKPVRDRDAYLDAHIALLAEAAGDHGLWLPSFNYDFPRSHLFDVAASESQLGPIPERFRVTAAGWRTPIPIFSTAGTGSPPSPSWGQDTDPFGSDSMFASLVAGDGVVLYYGDTFHYNTLVHYAERLSGGPVYRYDKVFAGTVVSVDGTRTRGSLNYHVRPLGTGLEYDWPRLLDEAIDAGVCRRLDAYPEILAAPARDLCDLWVRELRQDPLALLDEKTRGWVEPAIEELGRRFMITDFESPEPLYGDSSSGFNYGGEGEKGEQRRKTEERREDLGERREPRENLGERREPRENLGERREPRENLGEPRERQERQERQERRENMGEPRERRNDLGDGHE